ncbi:MAG: hemolysin family protein [Deltaproteobacteria bacterium]|nr:hemolysin family protein [Deltaproteobacteria bacterium]
MDSDGGSLWHRITRFFNAKGSDNVEQAIIEASHEGALQAYEGSMLLSILHLDELQVQDIMTPRTDITAVDSTSSIARAVAAIAESGHSRIPIYLDNRDNIVGIVYSKDLLREAMLPENHSKPVSSVTRPAFFVPETKNVLELLNEFKTKKTHLAVILDEYGGTSGLITIEDVLEEIVGDIEDEHDAPKEADVTMLENGGALIAGRAYLEDINDALGLRLESDEVDTIGGLLSHIAGRLPMPGEDFILKYQGGEAVFRVEEADSKQVHKVLAYKLEPGQNATAAEGGGPGLAANAGPGAG